MLQSVEAKVTTPPIKSISAVKKYPRSKTPQQRNARVAWKRIKDNIDDLVLKVGQNPELGSVISRWVLFGHLSRAEGYAARLYAEIVGQYERFFVEGSRLARSPSYERGTAGAQDVIAKHERLGTIADYERAARRARKRYNRAIKVLDRFPLAKQRLDEVCVEHVEIDASLRPHVAVVLRMLAVEFGLVSARDRDKKESKHER